MTCLQKQVVRDNGRMVENVQVCTDSTQQLGLTEQNRTDQNRTCTDIKRRTQKERISLYFLLTLMLSKAYLHLNLRWQKYVLGNFFKTWWVSNGWMIGQVTVTCFNLKFDWILIWSLWRGGGVWRWPITLTKSLGLFSAFQLISSPTGFSWGIIPSSLPRSVASWFSD